MAFPMVTRSVLKFNTVHVGADKTDPQPLTAMSKTVPLLVSFFHESTVAVA